MDTKGNKKDRRCICLLIVSACLFMMSCTEKNKTDNIDHIYNTKAKTLEGSWRGYCNKNYNVISLRVSGDEFHFSASEEHKIFGTINYEQGSGVNKVKFIHANQDGDAEFLGLYKLDVNRLIVVMGLPDRDDYPKSLYDTDVGWSVFSKGPLPKLGKYFEFEFESINPLSPGIYVINNGDFVAVDFRNSAAPYNTHAHSGKVVVTSVQPKYEGSFELSGFTEDHDPNTMALEGKVSGSFSIPSDGSQAGIFTATGNIDSYEVNIDFNTAYAKGDPNMLGFYRPPF